ncbi:MAG: hypothetical protein E6Q97_02115 [Desulfurellales bacterium]|nr:MAG: hypothetical protein E6Q97_02115 [Desulfurellales bacterium]
MTAPSTAARTTANYDRFYGTVMEEWDPGYEDLVFEAFEWLWIVNQFQKVWKTGGRDIIGNANANKNTSAKAFRGLDTLTPPAEEGPLTWKVSMANYVVSMRELWEESIEHSGEMSMLDIFKETIERAAASLGELLNTSFKEGSFNGSKHCVGLEEAVYYKSHGSGATGDVIRGFSTNGAFQADNSYLGIARSGTDDGAKGWRNGSVDATGDSNFSTSSQSYAGFRRLHSLLTRGNRRPDVALMTLKPYENFEALAETLIKFEKYTNGEGGTANIPFDTLKWHDMLIVKWEQGTASTIAAATNDADASDDMVYMLASWTWKIAFETQAYFAQTPWVQANDALARTSHMVVRTSGPYCINPRYNGVMGDYGV